MPISYFQRKQVKKREIGSLNSRITLFQRYIETSLIDEANYGMKFTKILDMWACVESLDGVTIFDQSEIEQTVSHKITIRYVPEITYKNMMEYRGEYYNILKVDNSGKENLFLTLWVNLRGSKDKRVNLV